MDRSRAKEEVGDIRRARKQIRGTRKETRRGRRAVRKNKRTERREKLGKQLNQSLSNLKYAGKTLELAGGLLRVSLDDVRKEDAKTRKSPLLETKLIKRWSDAIKRVVDSHKGQPTPAFKARVDRVNKALENIRKRSSDACVRSLAINNLMLEIAQLIKAILDQKGIILLASAGSATATGAATASTGAGAAAAPVTAGSSGSTVGGYLLAAKGALGPAIKQMKIFQKGFTRICKKLGELGEA